MCAPSLPPAGPAASMPGDRTGSPSLPHLRGLPAMSRSTVRSSPRSRSLRPRFPPSTRSTPTRTHPPHPGEGHRLPGCHDLDGGPRRDEGQLGHGIVATGGIEQNCPYLAAGERNVILRLTTEAIATRLGNALVAPIVPEGDIDPPTLRMHCPSTIGFTEGTYRALLSEERIQAERFRIKDWTWPRSAKTATRGSAVGAAGHRGRPRHRGATDRLEAVLPQERPRHWMTGIEKGSSLDKATGFREAGDGLRVVASATGMSAGSPRRYRISTSSARMFQPFASSKGIPSLARRIAYRPSPLRLGEGSASCRASRHRPPRASAGIGIAPRSVTVPASGVHRRGSASARATRWVRSPWLSTRATCLRHVRRGEADVAQVQLDAERPAGIDRLRACAGGPPRGGIRAGARCARSRCRPDTPPSSSLRAFPGGSCC